MIPSNNSYDMFGAAASTPLATPAPASHPQTNLFQDTAMGGAAFYQGSNNYQQPVQYHLYAPIGPHRTDILPYQRHVHDLFIPNDLREDLQKKAAASLQTFASRLLHVCQLLGKDSTDVVRLATTPTDRRVPFFGAT